MGPLDPASLVIGVDVGQRVDPTALCVAEQRGDGATSPFRVRHLERRPLGEAYPLVAARVAAVVVGAIRAARQPVYADGTGEHPEGWILSNGFDFPLDVTLRLDATGVGRPVCELVSAALADADLAVLHATLSIEYCTFTFGDHLSWSGDERRVGKAFLVSRLQALLHTNRVRLPKTSEALALAAELLTYEIKVDPDGDAKFGAFKTGAHDDLVTSLGLATLEDRNNGGGTGSYDYRHKRWIDPPPRAAPHRGR